MGDGVIDDEGDGTATPTFVVTFTTLKSGLSIGQSIHKRPDRNVRVFTSVSYPDFVGFLRRNMMSKKMGRS